VSEEENPASTAEVRKLSRSLKEKVLATELGQNWRSIRWWARQFTPVSTTILGVVLTGTGTWIYTLSHTVDNQGTRIVVLETQIVPDLKLEVRVAQTELAIAKIQGRLGDFDIPTVKLELAKPLQLHGRPIQPAKIEPPKRIIRDERDEGPAPANAGKPLGRSD
jgi:hypothetical protein